ncbi:uncharacterized protein TNCV_394371 [Trichonephila clavipes]|nr:uncharacterized protein TNCV_394371 [Trichonephila clavipes]
MTSPVQSNCDAHDTIANRQYGAVWRSGSIPQQSSFFVLGKIQNDGVDGWASRAAHVMGAAIPNVFHPSTLVWFLEDTGAPIEGATCAWMAVDESVGCTRAYLTMWWSSRRLVCRGRPEP